MQHKHMIILILGVFVVNILVFPFDFTNNIGHSLNEKDNLQTFGHEIEPKVKLPNDPDVAVSVIREPIIITNDANFTSENGVISGNGTEDDPFVINGFSISGWEYEWAVKITDTTKHVVIRNMIIEGIRNGIYLGDAANIRVENCWITNIHGENGFDSSLFIDSQRGNNCWGILVESSTNVTLANLTITDVVGGRGGDGFTTDTASRLHGSDGGSALGIDIFCTFIDDNVNVENCTVSHVEGGRGGHGADGPVVSGAIESGWDGGYGGTGGSSFGMRFHRGSGTVVNNKISHIYSGSGGNGGNGSDPGSAAGSPGDGGNGGDSGNVFGLYWDESFGVQVSQNYFTDLQQGSGGNGGNAGSNLHSVAFVSTGCDGGNVMPLIGIYSRVVQNSLLMDNVFSMMYSNAPGIGGFNTTTVAPYGENHPLYGLYLYEGCTGMQIYGNIFSDFFTLSNPTEAIALNLQLISINNSVWFNHFGGDINVNIIENIKMNNLAFGNYWLQNKNITDNDPVDGISDEPYLIYKDLDLYDYLPLAYGLLGDEDGDGLSNKEEYRLRTDILDPDTDHDTLPDGWEVEHGLDPKSSLEAEQDHDLDGLNLILEYYYGTDYLNSDSDGDSFDDGTELAAGTDPLDPLDFPTNISNGTDDSDNTSGCDCSQLDSNSTINNNPTEADDNSDSAADNGSEGSAIPGYPIIGLLGLFCIVISFSIYAIKNKKIMN